MKMKFTDDEIKEFKQIALNYNSELIKLEQAHEDIDRAAEELWDQKYHPEDFDKLFKSDMATLIHDCKERIKRMERFEVWVDQMEDLEQNNDKVM